jgi:hypothetical protein
MIGKFLFWIGVSFGLVLIMSYDFVSGMLAGLLLPVVVITKHYIYGAVKTYLEYKRNPRESIFIGRMNPRTYKIIWH